MDKDDGRVGRKVDNIHSTGSWIGKVHVIVLRTRTRVTSWRTLGTEYLISLGTRTFTLTYDSLESSYWAKAEASACSRNSHLCTYFTGSSKVAKYKNAKTCA